MSLKEFKRRRIKTVTDHLEGKARLKELLHEKLLRTCRKDPNVFINYVGQINKGWYKQSPLHVRWQNALTEHERVLLICPREHGKCLAGDSLLYTKTGERIPVKDWRGGQVLALNTNNMKLEWAEASPAWTNGDKQTYRLTTKTGRSIACTGNHPLYKVSGWTNTENLKIGDSIAVTVFLGDKLPESCKLFLDSIFWDEIVSIEDAGIQETFDIEVPDYHNFVVDDIIAHNTAQSILRTIWEIGINPDLRIKLVCQNDDIAVKRLSAMIEHIEQNPRVTEVFPGLKASVKGAWTKSRIYVERDLVGSTDPSIEACGILSTATGGRADLLIFDDPVDFRNAIQMPSLRDMVKEVYDNVWINLLDENGRVWYIATPWHRDDNTHRLMENKSYHFINDSIDADFTSIWEDKWPTERLRERYEEIGSRAFDRAFRNKALSDEDTLFPVELIERCYDDTFIFGSIPKYFEEKRIHFFTGVDIAAGKQRTSGAYSVIFTIAWYEGIKVPVSIIRGRFPSPQLSRLIIEEIVKWNPELIFIENNAQQEALIQWINETSPEFINTIPPIKGYYTGVQKFDEQIGLPGIAVEMEQGKWIIPDPTSHGKCKCSLCTWINEMSEYPIGKYSDTVMAMWFSREAARSVSSGKIPKISGLLSMPDNLNEREALEYSLAYGDDDDD